MDRISDSGLEIIGLPHTSANILRLRPVEEIVRRKIAEHRIDEGKGRFARRCILIEEKYVMTSAGE